MAEHVQRIAMLVAGAVAGGLLVLAFGKGGNYGGYEECVLANMKGHRLEMRSTVTVLCRKQFPAKPVSIKADPGGLDFSDQAVAAPTEPLDFSDQGEAPRGF